MDGKDVDALKSLKSSLPVSSNSKQKRVKTLSVEKISLASQDSVQVKIQSTSPLPLEKNRQAHSETNKAIDALNTVSKATDEISSLVESISGIVQQAGGDETSSSRRAALQREANDILEVVKSKTNIKTPSGAKPLLGDPIELKIEEKIGRELNIIFPNANETLTSLEPIQIPDKDSIIKTLAKIERGKESIEKIRLSIDEARGRVEDILAEAEVAEQNNAASNVQVRDVEDALQLTLDVRKSIIQNPTDAIDAAKVKKDSLNLLS